MEWDLEAEEMKIEGAAAVFTNASQKQLKWNVLVIPLWAVDHISQYAED